MKTLIKTILLILLISSLVYSQESGIYGLGYKDLIWGMSLNDASKKLPSKYKFEDKASWLISDSDRYTSAEFEHIVGSHSDQLKATYDLEFLNNSLYSISLDVEAKKSKDYSFVVELWKDFFKKIESSYGKPYAPPGGYDDRAGAKWTKSGLEISAGYRTSYVSGTGWTMAKHFWLNISLKEKNDEVELIKDKHQEQLRERDSKKGKKRAKTFTDGL